MDKKENLLAKILFEAQSYRAFEDIEKLVELKVDLSMVPIQPLYVSLLNSSSEQVAVIIPKLSIAQRQTLLDLDLWRKDIVDVNSFEHWIEVYSKVPDLNITKKFVSSEEFLLYLKSRVNIHTFDAEEPEYPDHDNYFLTDDNLLLVEYSDEYTYPSELKYLIRNLYDSMGVEGAYTTLFKLINDSFAVLQERTYVDKKERLREFGFVDHFDALEKLHDFVGFKSVDKFIKDKVPTTALVDSSGKNQSLHSSALVSFQNEGMDNIFHELSMVKDEKRVAYLHFMFVRLVNSTIILADALKGGRIELTRIGKFTRNTLELGLQKIKDTRSFEEGESVFEYFDFFDVYRVGGTLVSLNRKRIKKSLRNGPFEEDDYEYFLGAWWGGFLDNSDLSTPKVRSYGSSLQAKEISSYEAYNFWKSEIDLFTKMIPFISSFFKTFVDLKTEGKLHDEFYLNYEVSNIDFESIIISSFINFTLDNFSEKDVNKMGVTISELKVFLGEFFVKKGEEYLLLDFSDEKILRRIQGFIQQFGFAEIEGVERYFYAILNEHLNGYEFDTLEEEDYKHIGGPILLNSMTKN